MKSIVTEYEDISAFTGNIAECRHHLIYGRGLRELAEKDGLWIPLTNREHNAGPELIYQIHGNPSAEHLSKICGQLAWERHQILEGGYTGEEARDAFLRRYGRSYL